MKSFSVKKAEFDERLLKIARATDAFECYQRPHATRVAAFAEALAQSFNLNSHDCYSLRQAALVHDVGEALMNRDYINSNRLLREDERVDMQRHTVIGEQESAKRGLNRAVQLLVRHHEWWNGAGYPDALEGEQIPLGARILRVCDTYSSMIEARPFRRAVSEAEAKRYLKEWAGIEFDPKVIKAFLSLKILEQLEKSKPNVEIVEAIVPQESEDFPLSIVAQS